MQVCRFDADFGDRTEVEDEFDVSISDKTVHSLVSVHDLYDYVWKHVKKTVRHRFTIAHPSKPPGLRVGRFRFLSCFIL